jgi:UDP-N-acetylmuramate-alanine ligase
VLEDRYDKILKITKEKEKITKVKKSRFWFKYILWDHNQQNWSLVKAIIKTLDNKTNIIKITNTMLNFKWLWRRLEFLWNNNNWSKIFSDYWHMASPIKIWYQALRWKFKKEKITVIFQPHQINRIETWRNDFIKVFKDYDQAFIYDIYAARESLATFKKFKIKSIQDLWNNFAKVCWWRYISNFEDIKKIIQSWKKNEIIVIYSAWDIDYKIRQNIRFSLK